MSVTTSAPTSSGWYQADEIAALASASDVEEPDAEHVAVMQALMRIGGRERLEFLSGLVHRADALICPRPPT